MPLSRLKIGRSVASLRSGCLRGDSGRCCGPSLMLPACTRRAASCCGFVAASAPAAHAAAGPDNARRRWLGHCTMIAGMTGGGEDGGDERSMRKQLSEWVAPFLIVTGHGSVARGCYMLHTIPGTTRDGTATSIDGPTLLLAGMCTSIIAHFSSLEILAMPVPCSGSITAGSHCTVVLHVQDRSASCRRSPRQARSKLARTDTSGQDHRCIDAARLLDSPNAHFFDLDCSACPARLGTTPQGSTLLRSLIETSRSERRAAASPCAGGRCKSYPFEPVPEQTDAAVIRSISAALL